MEGLSALAAALAALSTLTSPQKPADHRWIVEGFLGRSTPGFLGTEDHRTTGGLGVHYTRPERRFKLRGTDAEFGLGGYMGFSSSDGVGQDPPNSTTELGVLAYGRWLVKSGGSARLYGDLGWGFQYTTRRTHDLSSRLNSTPFVGFGVMIPSGSHDFLVGMRLIHMSNAGTSRHNRGANQLWLTAGVRF